MSRTTSTAAALALLDSVTPTDHRVMQAREQAALRLAERTGNVERARQAAERLFGLRLDSETQLDLAARMHRLGMHELAETVQARAQRQAGSKTATLVQLMTQFQTQGQADQAVAIARQLLRKTTAGGGGRGQGDENDMVPRPGRRRPGPFRQARRDRPPRRGATQGVAQLAANPPDFAQLLRGDRQQGKAEGDDPEDRRTETRRPPACATPSPASSRPSATRRGAMANYKAAIKKEPTLFQQNYYEVQRLFSEANKFEELVALVEELDAKKLGQSYYVMSVVEPLLEKPKTRDLGMRLFKKVWAAFPDERGNVLSNLRNDDLWKTPELYEFAREAIVPPPGQSAGADPWQALTQVIGSDASGKSMTPLSQVLSAARKQHRLGELQAQVEARLAENPDWLAGKAVLAVIELQTGDKARGKAAWLELFGKPRDDVPPAARLRPRRRVAVLLGGRVHPADA